MNLTQYKNEINYLKAIAADKGLLYSKEQTATLFTVDLNELTDIRINFHILVERIHQEMKAESTTKGSQERVPSRKAIMAEVMSQIYDGKHTSSLAKQGSLRNSQEWGDGLSSSALPLKPVRHVKAVLGDSKDKKLLELRVCENKAFSCFVEGCVQRGLRS